MNLRSIDLFDDLTDGELAEFAAVARDERGFILAGPDVRENGWPLGREPYLLETTVPGVFVAGDVRARSIKRVASAVGEGSMAVSLIHEYLAQA